MTSNYNEQVDTDAISAVKYLLMSIYDIDAFTLMKNKQNNCVETDSKDDRLIIEMTDVV